MLTETREAAIRLVAGDALPKPELTIRGLEADPTGATAKFSLFGLDDAPVVDEASASVGSIASYSDHGATRWKLTATYAWGDTSALSGYYYARFTVTLPAAAGIISAPADRRFVVFVLPAEAP